MKIQKMKIMNIAMNKYLAYTNHLYRNNITADYPDKFVGTTTKLYSIDHPKSIIIIENK